VEPAAIDLHSKQLFEADVGQSDERSEQVQKGELTRFRRCLERQGVEAKAIGEGVGELWIETTRSVEEPDPDRALTRLHDDLYRTRIEPPGRVIGPSCFGPISYCTVRPCWCACSMVADGSIPVFVNPSPHSIRWKPRAAHTSRYRGSCRCATATSKGPPPVVTSTPAARAERIFSRTAVSSATCQHAIEIFNVAINPALWERWLATSSGE
jgi:hypothetical protein